jgi:hypothetical protein
VRTKASFTTMRALAGKLKPTEGRPHWVAGIFSLLGDSIKKCAADLHDEMSRRRLKFTPIEWLSEPSLGGSIMERRAGLTVCKKITSEKSTNADVVDSRQGGR